MIKTKLFLKFLIISIIILFLISGCNKNMDTEIVLDSEKTIPQEECKSHNLGDKIIILESKYCGACKKAVPILKEIEKELGEEFIFLDLSNKEDLEKLKEFKIKPKYTPTVIIGCKVLIGAKEKEEYKKEIENFLVNNL